jgi:hypothetical protein
MTHTTHPDPENLRRFVLGRLDRAMMARVVGHLQSCPRCVLDAARVPDDGFVALLRRADERGEQPRSAPVSGPSVLR